MYLKELRIMKEMKIIDKQDLLKLKNKIGDIEMEILALKVKIDKMINN
jgi:hypothetical protein